jgi:hemophore-related protein
VLVRKCTKMAKLLSTTLVVAFGGLAMSLTSGVASAQPDMGSLINTTCGYSQVVAALDAQSPELSNQFNTQPMAQSMLRTFLASPVDQRQQIVQAHGAHWGPEFTESLLQVANVCNNY